MKKDLLEEKTMPAINYHLWRNCNMNCKFCFGQFNNINNNNKKFKQLKEKESIELVQKIVNYGFEKITFSGGEPTLCPWFHKLLKITKKEKLITCIVTNGSNITDEWLKENHNYIDWIALSIDSVNPETNLISGRYSTNNSSQDYKYYMDIIKLIKRYNIKLKINTVVSKYNYNEDISNFIIEANPKRWKLFQALPIKGENEKQYSNFRISLNQFAMYKKRHSKIKSTICMITESNYQMTSSYLMIDPSGRFFDNSNNRLNFSQEINTVGIDNAIQQCLYSYKKFIQRGGLYNW